MPNYYSEVMGILFDGSVDYVGLVREIARKHPKIVVDAVNSQYQNGWRGRIKSMMDSGHKMEAIKLWRAETGLGLKEAKEAVEEYVAK